jgi:hypothetical protein
MYTLKSAEIKGNFKLVVSKRKPKIYFLLSLVNYVQVSQAA